MKSFLGYSSCPGTHRNGVEGTWEQMGHREVTGEFREAVWEHTGVPGVPGSMWGAQRRLWRLEGIYLSRTVEASGVRVVSGTCGGIYA